MLYLLIALLITAIIGYCVETIKMKLTLDQVHRLNREIGRRVDEVVRDESVVDMFLINRLRTMLKTEFLAGEKIDDFRIYKLDARRIRLSFRKKLAVQKLDIYVGNTIHRLEEISLDYIEDQNLGEAL